MAAKQLYDNIGQALLNFGDKVVKIARSMYLNEDKKASGKLINNLKSKLYYKKGIVELVFSSTKYLGNVEFGRKAGSKFPPSQPISKWIRQKHIQFTNKDGSPMNLKSMTLYLLMKGKTITLNGILCFVISLLAEMKL